MKINPKLNKYSTTEQSIGIWKNKPLYRKIIDTTSPPNADTNANIYTFTENIENIINIYGFLNAGSPSYKGDINCFITSNDYIATWCLTSNFIPQAIRCRCSGNRTNSAMSIVIEYTKTTD